MSPPPVRSVDSRASCMAPTSELPTFAPFGGSGLEFRPTCSTTKSMCSRKRECLALLGGVRQLGPERTAERCGRGVTRRFGGERGELGELGELGEAWMLCMMRTILPLPTFDIPPHPCEPWLGDKVVDKVVAKDRDIMLNTGNIYLFRECPELNLRLLNKELCYLLPPKKTTL